jgi:hypothetical protein
MHRSIGFLLALSVSLYSTPLKADSYDTTAPENYTGVSSENTNTECPVTPQAEQMSPQEPSPLETTDPYVERAPSSPQNNPDASQTYTDKGNYTDQEAVVSPENNEVAKRQRNTRWRNILLAVAVVVVAITALILVHQHEGHKSH